MVEIKETSGIIYVATGKKYIEMAISSARSVRKFNPGLGIHLFADWKQQGYDLNDSRNPFSSISNIDDPHSRSKVDYFDKAPFDRILYLDTDTRVVADLSPLFSLLDQFDVALAHAHLRTSRLQEWKIKIPESFPQFNSGVFLYKKTPEVEQLLDTLRKEFYLAQTKDDQLILRELLWAGSLRIATLPPEYNIRFLKYPLLWKKREARPRIYHLHMYQRGVFWFLDPFYLISKDIYRVLLSIRKGLRTKSGR